MGKNQAVEKAEYFAESIGRMAYQALLEEGLHLSLLRSDPVSSG